jgi:hypothetical protein
MLEGAMIRASCHTADNALSLGFDATEWFRVADAESIREIAARNWSSAWIVDALEARPGYESLHRLVDHARHRLSEESLEDPLWSTFECVVNEVEAMAWLDENRPEITAAIRSAPASGTGPSGLA